MERILVTTDFSANSKAGIRFAIQMATQHTYELVFFHSFSLRKKITETEQSFRDDEKALTEKSEKKLITFVDSVYKQMNVQPKTISFVVGNSVLTDVHIREYAEEHNFDFVCMSTRGAGKIKRLLGTNTSNLISHSRVPILAVPHDYRVKHIDSVLYASDLENLDDELSKVVAFANPLDAKVMLLHLVYVSEDSVEKGKIDSAIKKFPNKKIEVFIGSADFAKGLIHNMEMSIQKAKPSVLVMFTEQNKSFFEKLFISSLTAEYSFNAKVPMIVFNKFNAQD